MHACREGTAWENRLMKKLLAGEATTKELDLMLEIADNMEGKTILCLLVRAGDAGAEFHQEVPRRFRKSTASRRRFPSRLK